MISPGVPWAKGPYHSQYGFHNPRQYSQQPWESHNDLKANAERLLSTIISNSTAKTIEGYVNLFSMWVNFPKHRSFKVYSAI